MKELFAIPGFLPVHLFQQLVLILGRRSSARVFVELSQSTEGRLAQCPSPLQRAEVNPGVEGLFYQDILPGTSYFCDCSSISSHP